MEAKEEFLKDKVLIDSLSEHIIEKFIEAKMRNGIVLELILRIGS